MRKLFKGLIGSLIAGITSIGLLNCGFATQDHVIVVHSSDPVIVSAAQDAAAEWNWCGKEQLLITTNQEYVDNNSIPLYIMPQGQILLMDDGGPAAGLTQWKNETPIWIKVIYFNDQALYTPVIAHEFGHVMTGKLHQPTGLMSGEPIVDPTLHVVESDCLLFKD